jgi:CO/xanthine dehydrogenase FAD-binding subunit
VRTTTAPIIFGGDVASYLRPTALQEALRALSAGPRAILAGGTDFYPARVGRVVREDVLDISALPELKRVEDSAAGWRIPAMCTWADLLATKLPPLFDGLKRAAREIGGAQIQNTATLCGNICNASPAGDGMPCLLALDARVELASLRGTRSLPLAAFMLGPRRTARAPDEMMTAIHVPRPIGEARGNFLKLGARRYLVISIAMVAATLEVSRGHIVQSRIAVGACSPVAQRLPALEAALIGRKVDGDVVALVEPAHLAPLAPIGDMRASAAYRSDVALTLVVRALAELCA